MEYVLSIVGVVFLGVMVDVVAPEGKMNAFIKSIFSLFLLFVMLKPVVNIFSGGKLEKLFNSEFQLQEDYLETINEQKLREYEHKIVSRLEAKGVSNLYVEIKGDLTKENGEIEKVYINTQNIVLNGKDKHINKYEVITECVKEILGVGSEVIIYE